MPLTLVSSAFHIILDTELQNYLAGLPDTINAWLAGLQTEHTETSNWIVNWEALSCCSVEVCLQTYPGPWVTYLKVLVMGAECRELCAALESKIEPTLPKAFDFVEVRAEHDIGTVVSCIGEKPMTALSNADHEVIVHALGLNRRGACGNHCRWSSRNFYYGRTDDPQLVSLVERGLMIAGRTTTFRVMPNGQYFHVTSAGARAVGMENRVRREDCLKHEQRP